MKTEELIDLLKCCGEKDCVVCPDIEDCVGPACLLREAADALITATASLNAMWISVEVRMPPMQVAKWRDEPSRDYSISDYVLVWDGQKVEIAQAVSDESGLYWVDRCADVVNAVSWMPLPTPPEQS